MTSPAPPVQRITDTPSGILTGADTPDIVEPAPQVKAPVPDSLTKDEVSALLARVRQEEKDKLYSRVEKLQGDLRTLTDERQSRLKEQQDAADALAKKAKDKVEEEMDLRKLLATKEQEWESRLENERQERLRSEALRDQEIRYSQLSEYRAQKIQEHGDDIMPELVDMVTGDSEEEIDQSIAQMIQKSARIVEQTRNVFGEARRQAPGVSTAGSPPSGAMEINPENKQFSAQDIAGMSMKEFAKHRTKLFGQARANNRGMFE